MVASAIVFRLESGEEWDRSLAFSHPVKIWGEDVRTYVRNIKPLVEVDARD